MANDDPAAAFKAILGLLPLALVCLVMALLTIWFVSRSAAVGVKLGVYVFGMIFGIMFFMTQIETIYFLDAVKMPWQVLVATLSSGLLVCIALALFAMRLRHKLGEPRARVGMNTQQLPLKFGIISLAYVVIYFLAGYYIAWQVPELRQYYSGSLEKLPFLVHMGNVLIVDYWLTPFQVLRGFLWALIGYFTLVSLVKIKLWERVLMLAIAMGVLPAIPLIISNPYMPETIRWTHLYEGSVSNFIFGLIIALILNSAKTESTN
uniref:Uncharacterized protein n=1 Tax=OCS116 cluster bacterium TaxID=2030921 RepID=A0A2A4ZAK1_9PROT